MTSDLISLSIVLQRATSTNGLEEPQHHHRAHPHWAVRRPHIQALLFVLFLVIYLLTVWEHCDAAADQG